MSQAKGIVFVILIALAILIVTKSAFVVNEREVAIKFKLGEIVKTDFKPGLYFQIPFFNNVQIFDARLQTLDAKPQRYLTAEKKNVLVDSFVKWRIADVATFYTSMSGDYFRANQQLFRIIDKQLRDEFGKRTIQEVVSGERAQIMDILTKNSKQQAEKYGIKIVDVRVKRVDLPANVSNSVFARMSAERDRIAKEFRARGRAEAVKIRAEADRKYTVTLAAAYRDSEKMRGEGDAKAAGIYANAYSKDKEFYSFYRSLNAYKSSFNNKSDVMLLEPDSEFFKYFKNSIKEKKK